MEIKTKIEEEWLLMGDEKFLVHIGKPVCRLG
jgi:hypothetical protein